MIIRSKEDLRSYVLKRLGYPVITINIEESQLQDRLDDALEFFQLYSDEGQVKTYTKHIITEEEISNHLLQIPDDVIAITQIIQQMVLLIQLGILQNINLLSEN